jgi:signal transduction histidine kinase
MREEFLTSVSHDLRTPLTSAKGFAQLLRRRVARGAHQADPALLAEGFETIDASMTRMAALVGQLLDVSRLQSGRPLDLDLHPTDLVATARRVVAEHQRTSERHSIDVQTGAEEIVGLWDTVRIERVLGNLLSNAVKYSPRGGDILLRISREHDETAAAWAVLTVEDQGIGIPRADLPHVFDRFHRGSNVIGKIAGTGIGMAGVRQIVEQHGGSIAVDSEEGVGTTVSVCLPLRPPIDDSDALYPPQPDEPE